MHEELKLIDVTIDDGYRFGLRIIRFIIGKGTAKPWASI